MTAITTDGPSISPKGAHHRSAWVGNNRARIAVLPTGASWRDIAGIGALGGIGLTVSLFIADLGFDDQRLRTDATIGVFAAVLVATVAATVLLRRRNR